MDDESILGVGMNLNLYTYSKSSNTWVVVPDSSLAPVGAADGGSSITIMPDGKILGLAVKNGSVQLHIREELNARWTEVPKSSLPTIRSAWERFRITVLQDGTILCLACHNNYLWRRSTLLNSEWEEVVNGSSTQAFMGVVGIASGEKVAIAQLTSEGSTFSTGLDLQIKLSKELEKLKRLEAKETLLNQLIDRVLKNQGTSQSTDIRELEEYIGKSQEREETFKRDRKFTQFGKIQKSLLLLPRYLQAKLNAILKKLPSFIQVHQKQIQQVMLQNRLECTHTKQRSP
jgi:hypothetical protein